MAVKRCASPALARHTCGADHVSLGNICAVSLVAYLLDFSTAPRGGR